jgi:hypothetical protein
MTAQEKQILSKCRDEGLTYETISRILPYSAPYLWHTHTKLSKQRAKKRKMN